MTAAPGRDRTAAPPRNQRMADDLHGDACSPGAPGDSEQQEARRTSRAGEKTKNGEIRKARQAA